jgi:hypothetical protein
LRELVQYPLRRFAFTFLSLQSRPLRRAMRYPCRPSESTEKQKQKTVAKNIHREKFDRD